MRRRGLYALAVGALVAGGAACAEGRFAVEGERALARVRHQVEAGPRVPGTSGHAAVRDWIASELTRLGAQVERQSFMDSTLGRPEELVNVIGRYRPAKGSSNGRVLVLCAHYDTRPWADADPDSSRWKDPIPGANDGGSGVAVLLEMAEMLAQRPPPGPVDLVFFDGEDQGREGEPDSYSRGARGYVARLGEPKPRAAILFDMVGDRDLAIHPEGYSVERAANLAALVLEAAQATGGTHFHSQSRYRIVDDHVPFLDAGVPAVDVIDFDYPAWHTMSDLPEQLSPESLAEVARVAAWLVYRSPLLRVP